MAINTDIWGLPENWNTFDDDNIIAVIKQPSCKVGEYNYRTFFRLAENNKIDLNSDIDTSLCVSGMGAECPYSNVNYYTVKNGAVESDTQNRDLTNWFFFNTSQKSAYTEQNYVTYLYSDDHYGQYRNFENTLSETNNGNRWISPFIDYDVKDFVLLLRVECSDSPTGSQHYYYLDEYISTYYNTYPYVFRIYARLYAKSGTSPLRRKYIYQGVIEGTKYCTSAICDNYETTLVQTNKRMYCNHIGGRRGNNIPVWGSSIDKDYTYFPCANYDENGLIGVVYGDSADFETTTQSGNLYVYHHVTDITAFAEKARRAASAFGCYFTGDENTAEYGSLTDTKMYIGVLDDNLIAHGDYLQGTDTASAIQNDWTTVRDSTYNPNVETDNTKYQNDTEFYDSTLANGFTRFWVLDANGVSRVLNEMYNIMNDVDPDEPIERYSQKVFLTNNPIDCIISLKKFPVLHIPSLSGVYFMNFGSKATNITGSPLAKSCETYTFNFSAANDTSLYPVFGGDFRDFEPYTKCEIVIPFCGSVDIPCCYFYEYGGITVKLTIDFISGACTGFVLANGITINSVSGNCAIDMPVSGIQSATLDSQIFSAAQAKKQNFTKTRAGLVASALTATAGAVTGNPLLLVAGAAGVLTTAISSKETVKNIDYELQHLQTPYKEVSTASGQIAQSFDMRCKLIITRPKMLNFDENAYAETVGYACLNSGSVDDFHGLTYGAIELNGVPCTADEKSYIETMFANGVHLPTAYPS